jgi:site-specific recombinase XerD
MHDNTTYRSKKPEIDPPTQGHDMPDLEPRSPDENALDAHTPDQLGRPFQSDDNVLSVYLRRYDRENTRRAYRRDLVQFFGTDTVTPEMITRASFMHVNRHIERLQHDGLKASTIRRKVAALRGFFDWLVALDVIDRNPADKTLIRSVRASNKSDQTMTFLTKQQAEALVQATDAAGEASMRDRTLITTLIHCVLRRSEAAAMDAEHIRALGRYWVLDLPEAKGGSDQYVKIPAHVVEQIDRMKAHYGITSGALWRSFSNRNYGDRITAHTIYRIVRRTAERAGLPDIGAHALRHTGCTLAIEAGASLQQVQTHARHKNIETTMMYIHQRDKLRDSAADHIHIDDQ